MAATPSNPAPRIIVLPLAKITLDRRCASRASAPDPQKIQEYYEALVEQTAELPPVEVFDDGTKTYWLADGRLRLEAYRQAGRSAIECRVHAGGLRAARLHAAQANATHGLPRTPADKRKQVWIVLELLEEEGGINQWPNAEVARHCQVSGPLVAALKKQYLELKDKARRELEDAEARAAGILGQGPAPIEEADDTAGFLKVGADVEEDDDDDDDTDEERFEAQDVARARERGYRALRKAQRFAQVLGLTLEQLVTEWRADPRGRTTLDVAFASRQARDAARAAKRAAVPTAPKNPFEE